MCPCLKAKISKHRHETSHAEERRKYISSLFREREHHFVSAWKRTRDKRSSRQRHTQNQTEPTIYSLHTKQYMTTQNNRTKIRLQNTSRSYQLIAAVARETDDREILLSCLQTHRLPHLLPIQQIFHTQLADIQTHGDRVTRAPSALIICAQISITPLSSALIERRVIHGM